MLVLVKFDSTARTTFSHCNSMGKCCGLQGQGTIKSVFRSSPGWCAIVLGKLPVPGRAADWIIVGHGPTVLVIGAGGVVWTFTLSLLFPSLRKTALYRLKYCLKGP